MKPLKGSLWLITLPRMVVGLFIILNIIAMLSYPGSTYLDSSSLGYSFTHNFLSDLGRTLSYSGEVNFLSSQLFNMSLILAGGIFTLFYFHVHNAFSEDSQGIPARLGSVFGALGGLSLVGVGFTPSDLYLELHIVCATWLFRFFFVASICYSWVIFHHARFENKYALGYVMFTFSILMYILISELGPDPKVSQFSLALQVVAQKIILLIFISAIFTQTLGLQKLRT